MEKLFRLTITELNPETKEPQKTHIDENYTSIAVVAKCEDGKAAEMIINDNLLSIAGKLASSRKLATAVRLAKTLMDIKQGEAQNSEDALIRAIMEG